MGLGSFISKAVGIVGKIAGSPAGSLALGLIPGGGTASTLLKAGLGQLAAAKAPPMVFPGTKLVASSGGGKLGPFAWGSQGKPPLQFGPSSGIPFLAPPGFGGLATAPPAGYRFSEDPRIAGTLVRRYRRMNPANTRAARRAIRRIKSTRKLLQSIESQLPRRRAAACAPRRKVCR